MRTKFFLIISALLLALNLTMAPVTQAAYGLEETATAAKLTWSGSNLPQRLGIVINAVLGAIGIVFLILTIYGGFRIMLSYGAPEELAKGKKTVLYAVIGLVVITSAYALTSFVLTRVGQ